MASVLMSFQGVADQMYMDQFEKIQVPAYVVASYSSELHTRGSIEGFRRMSSKDKWLRIHNTQEWPDLYDPK